MTPQLLPLFMLREVEMGATIEEVAQALNVEMEWARERVEAVRLCFAGQVRVVAMQRTAAGVLRDNAA